MELSKEKLIIQGLSEKRFVFYLQPKVDLRNGKIIGAEALARFITLDGHMIMPGEFIEVMEKNGLITELDMYIFTLVCAHIAERIKADLPVVPISVNVSALHFAKEGVYEKFHAVAERYKVPSEFIEFELTETLVAENTEDVKIFVDKARSHGYRVSVDDFGSGYAGINMWREYDVDTIKLDRKFLIGDEEEQRKNLTILPDIISTSKRLGFSVLSEGVETKEQCDTLLKLDCTKAQGYYFAKPMPVNEFYEKYEASNFYETVYKNERKKEKIKRTLKNGVIRRKKANSLIVALCAGILFLLVFLGIKYQQNEIAGLFEDSIKNRLGEYNNAIVEEFNINVLSVIENVEAISFTGDESVAKLYVENLNKNTKFSGIVYKYHTASELPEMEKSEIYIDSEIDIERAFEERKTVIASIKPESTEGNKRWFGVATPLYRNNVLEGVVSAVIYKDILNGVNEHTPPFGEIGCILIADKNYKILHSSCNGISAYKSCVFKHLSEHLNLEKHHVEIEKDFRGNPDFNIGVYKNSENMNNFITVGEAGVNDWKIFVNYTSNESHAYTKQLSSLFIRVNGMLLVAATLLVYIIVKVFKRTKYKSDEEVKLYNVLEQLSDITVFEYDVAKDKIKFSQNMIYYFDTSWTDSLAYKGFGRDIEKIEFIHEPDREKVKELFMGAETDGGSRNIKLKSAEGNYIWCNIEYRYIFRKGKLMTVAGKITIIES